MSLPLLNSDGRTSTAQSCTGCWLRSTAGRRIRSPSHAITTIRRMCPPVLWSGGLRRSPRTVRPWVRRISDSPPSAGPQGVLPIRSRPRSSLRWAAPRSTLRSHSSGLLSPERPRIECGRQLPERQFPYFWVRPARPLSALSFRKGWSSGTSKRVSVTVHLLSPLEAHSPWPARPSAATRRQCCCHRRTMPTM